MSLVEVAKSIIEVMRNNCPEIFLKKYIGKEIYDIYMDLLDDGYIAEASVIFLEIFSEWANKRIKREKANPEEDIYYIPKYNISIPGGDDRPRNNIVGRFIVEGESKGRDISYIGVDVVEKESLRSKIGLSIYLLAKIAGERYYDSYFYALHGDKFKNIEWIL